MDGQIERYKNKRTNLKTLLEGGGATSAIVWFFNKVAALFWSILAVDLQAIFGKGSFIYYVRKIFRKTNIS